MCPCAYMCAKPYLILRTSSKTNTAATSPLAMRLQTPREKRTPHQQQMHGASAPRSAIDGQLEQQCKRFVTLVNIAAVPCCRAAPRGELQQHGHGSAADTTDTETGGAQAAQRYLAQASRRAGAAAGRLQHSRAQCRCALHRGTAVGRKPCSSTGIAAQRTQQAQTLCAAAQCCGTNYFPGMRCSTMRATGRQYERQLKFPSVITAARRGAMLRRQP